MKWNPRLPLLVFVLAGWLTVAPSWAVTVEQPKPGEDVIKYVERIKGAFDSAFFHQVLGAANAFKEGDEIVGVAADTDVSRVHARMLLGRTKIADIHDRPMLEDQVQKLIWGSLDQKAYEKIKGWTMDELKQFLLMSSEEEIKAIMPGLDSDVVGCVVKILSNPELTLIGQKVFNPLPGTKIGAKGYLGARIQPNSPTDNPEDIIWQVFSGWSYGTGDVVLGTNPVSGLIDDLKAVEEALKDLVVTFGLEKHLPWCVLTHVDKQAEVEKAYPGTTALWFQSLASCDDANQTFDVSVEKMRKYATMRNGPYGMYFETGQGADFTNGAGHGFDMVIHESRKYGFARALKQDMAKVAPEGKVWTITNDVAGFIGPEVFRSREQLVRCCLEDIVMGKLHGLSIGLDICSTLHMPISLEDLDWCADQILPANPGYLMALPTKNDPMLSYLTTAFQNHVRLRQKFGYQVNDAMADFFRKIQIVISDGLNCRSLTDEGHLAPYLEAVRKELAGAGLTVAPEPIIVKSGRVRAGYAIGNILFGQADPDKPKILLHIIGERPGTEHRNYSVYLAGPKAGVWAAKKVDHDIATVVCGISDTALPPAEAAKDTMKMVNGFLGAARKP